MKERKRGGRTAVERKQVVSHRIEWIKGFHVIWNID
jgi:hypothetical protein